MIPADKLLHIILGVIWLGFALLIHLAYIAGGLGAALAASTTAYAAMYELSQWYRKDGQPEWLDAAATALPGFLAWALLEML